MKHPENTGSSASQSSQSSHPFLQDSSLITGIPAQLLGVETKLQGQPSGSVPKKESVPVSQPGEVLLNFTIRFTDLRFGDLLGQGGYGKVFAGEWKFNKVAIKQYTAQDFSEQTRQEIRKEAMVMATVSTQSDYLVRLRGMILEKPHYSLVMEYLPGGDLFHLLKSSESLTWPRRYQIGRDMAIGLHHLHERSVLHRDLKSLNVLLDGAGHAKLADFGLSTLKTSSASTTAGGFKGTVLWSAPELFKRGAKATVFSDMYSLGMVLWELASRKIPFADAATPAIAATWVAQGEQEVVPEETPKEFKQLIESCWDKEPSKRPAADVVAQRLDGLLQEHKTDSDPLNLPKQPLAEQKLQNISSEVTHDFNGLSPEALQSLMSGNKEKPTFGVPESSPSPKPVLGGATEDAEVMRLKLEQERDKQRILEMEKKAEEQAKRQPELDRRRAEEIKEIQQQPVEPKDKVSPTPPKKEQDLKNLTPLPPLSGSTQTLMPPPKPTLEPLDQKSLSKLQELLQWVAEGEQDKAEALIQTDRNLLLHTGTIKDLSGRGFKPITAFQYALWAMDYHMWTMIQKYLPQETQAQQCQELEAKGTAHGKHFSLQGLTGALQTYVDNAEKVWKYDRRAIDHWCKVVGGEQKLLPMHIVNEYCRNDRSFKPCPSEWEFKLPRTCEVPEIWDNTQSKYVKGSWFTPCSSKDRLGHNYAFLRSNSQAAVGGCVHGRGLLFFSSGWPKEWERGGADADLKALQSLWKTRTQQLELLKSQLLSVTNQTQFGSR